MISRRKLKKQICQIGRRMYERGFVAGSDGNISARAGVGRYLCTPTLVSKGFLTPSDIVEVDDQGRRLAGRARPTSEILLHLAMYRELGEVNAVVHAHPPRATAFAVAGEPLPRGVLPEVEIFLGHVPLAEYGTPGGAELAKTIVPHLRNKANTILLANHGAVCCGATLQQACFRMETLEQYCRILLLARQIGPVRQLSPDKLAELMEIKRRMGLDGPPE